MHALRRLVNLHFAPSTIANLKPTDDKLYYDNNRIYHKYALHFGYIVGLSCIEKDYSAAHGHFLTATYIYFKVASACLFRIPPRLSNSNILDIEQKYPMFYFPLYTRICKNANL